MKSQLQFQLSLTTRVKCRYDPPTCTYCQQSQHESSAQNCTNNPPTVTHHNNTCSDPNHHSSQPFALQRLQRLGSADPRAPAPPRLQPRTRQRYHKLKTKTHPHLHMPAPSKLSRRRARGNQGGSYRCQLSCRSSPGHASAQIQTAHSRYWCVVVGLDCLLPKAYRATGSSNTRRVLSRQVAAGKAKQSE